MKAWKSEWLPVEPALCARNTTTLSAAYVTVFFLLLLIS